MEDFESVAQGLQAQPRGRAAMTKNDHLTLTSSEAVIVARLPNSLEYNVILRIMEGELEKMETSHMQNYLDKDLFERTGLMAVAARMFYERIQHEINYHSAEFVGNAAEAELEAAVKQMSPEEFLRQGFGIEE